MSAKQRVDAAIKQCERRNLYPKYIHLAEDDMEEIFQHCTLGMFGVRKYQGISICLLRAGGPRIDTAQGPEVAIK